MNAFWILMAAVWAIVEFVQFLRKRSFRARMKAGACWGVAFAALAMYGQASRETSNLLSFLTGLAMFGIAALIVYWFRIGFANLWVSAFGKT